MKIASLEEILTEFQNNLIFRETFKKNPELALKEAGFEVHPDDLAKIQAKLDKTKNTKLDDRTTK
jgi:hypothetical protein